jgi:nucleoside phosphorylase
VLLAAPIVKQKMATTQRSHTDYTIGWICALPVEMAACKAMLEKIHPRLPQSPNDHNVYTLGELYGHNIVIACLPLGIYGICSAALVATHMLHTFHELRFTLLVGIGGGVPSDRGPDIRLGDVVVSKPTSTFGGVVQYDHGKAISGNRFQRTGALNKPPSILLAAISHLEADRMIGDTRIPLHLAEIMARFTRKTRPSYPGSEYDVLFEPEYQHIGDPDEACLNCSREHIVPRPPRSSTNPRIHYGLIASGNQVIKDGVTRDRVVGDLGGDILCFEMEAAGLMDDFKCLVIRGICDYADSHKNKLWQPYAAAVAAAYAKELLSIIPAVQLQTSPKAYAE